MFFSDVSIRVSASLLTLSLVPVASVSAIRNPLACQGLQAGDMLLKINGVGINKMSRAELLSFMLMIQSGASAELVVQRP